MRSAICVALLGALGAAACGGDVSGPGTAGPVTFGLERIDGEPLPLVTYENTITTVEATAGIIALEADGTFLASTTFLTTPRHGAATETTFTSGTYAWTDATLHLSYVDGTTDQGVLDGALLTLASGGSTFEFRRLEAPFELAAAYTFPDLAGDDFIQRFAFTGDGTLWVTSFGGSIVRVRSGKTTVWDAATDLGGERASGPFVDHADRVWIALGNGYAVHDGQSWTRFDAPAALTPGTSIGHVAVSGAGDVLLAAGHEGVGGLLLRTAGGWMALTPDNSLLPNHVTRSVAVDPAGDFWVASARTSRPGGLSRISGGVLVEVFDAEAGLLTDGAETIAVGGGGVVVGFDDFLHPEPGADGGIQVIPTGGGPVTSWFPAVTGLTSSRVHSLAVTDAGDIWFVTTLDEAQPTCATCFSGIGRLDAAGAFEVVSALNSDVPPNGYFAGIASDPSGVVYVGTEREIYRVVR